jgi:hypothetical protein
MHFIVNVDSIIAQGLKMFEFIHYTKSSVSTSEKLIILYVAAGRSKLEFAFIKSAPTLLVQV